MVATRSASTDICPLTTAVSGCYAGSIVFSRERILDALARLPFIDAGELALILGEPQATAHRALTALTKDGLAQRVSHGTAQLHSSHRYYLTKKGIDQAADALDFDAPSEFVRAYPVSRQWLPLLLRWMDAVAGWRGEVNVPGLTQVRPDLLVQVSEGTLGAGTHCIEFDRRAVQPFQAEHKLGPYRRMAAAGRPLPLLMVCETARGRQNFRAAAGTLPMLTTTLEMALAGPVTGPVTVWSRNGIPAALHCR